MKNNFSKSLKFVFLIEGGWSDHPNDPGGATMKGVTLAVYREYLGRDVSKEELRNIPDAHLDEIYRARYWNKTRCDDLPFGVDLSVFDFAVNSGASRAARLLQRSVGVVDDGIIGPKTIAAIKVVSAKHLIIRFAEDRRNFYKSLKTFDTFGRGWLRRTDECEKEALKMAGENP